MYIKDKSVSYVNLVIRSRLSFDQLNPVLMNPRRETIDIKNNENFVVTTTDSYILIKMLSPVSGRWKLHLDNATNENCTVSQLDFYSMYVKQSITDLNNTLVVGQSTRIVASLNNESGLVTDKSLTENVSFTRSPAHHPRLEFNKLTVSGISLHSSARLSDILRCKKARRS